MFLGSSVDNSNNTFFVENKSIKISDVVKLQGITIDYRLTAFTKQIKNLCIMARNHLRALTRLRKFLFQEQAKLLSEAYIMSAFKYSPLTWMFCGKTENNSINKIHKCTFWLINRIEDATFQDLLERDKSKNFTETSTEIDASY